MQAMILAAGFGTRLQPYTDYRPKPLFPVLNKPLLCLTIERLKNAGFDHIIVNCHHLKEQIVDALRDYPGVTVQQEQEILGTGGGLRKALSMMRDEPLLVTNGDIYHTIPFEKLYDAHIDRESRVTLAMHDFERFNKVQVVDGCVKCFDEKVDGAQSLAFTGLHVIDPEILASIEPDTYSCILELYRNLLKKQEEIHCYRTDFCHWTDMGTVSDYLKLHEDILHKKVHVWDEIGDIEGEQYCGDNMKVSPDAHMKGWCVCGDNVEICQDAVIDNSILWDNVVISHGEVVKNTLVVK